VFIVDNHKPNWDVNNADLLEGVNRIAHFSIILLGKKFASTKLKEGLLFVVAFILIVSIYSCKGVLMPPLPPELICLLACMPNVPRSPPKKKLDLETNHRRSPAPRYFTPLSSSTTKEPFSIENQQQEYFLLLVFSPQLKFGIFVKTWSV
jgi:hypothetical protein